MTASEKEAQGRKNPDCYDEQGGYVGPGAEHYGSTQTVDENGEPLIKSHSATEYKVGDPETEEETEEEKEEE